MTQVIGYVTTGFVFCIRILCCYQCCILAKDCYRLCWPKPTKLIFFLTVFCLKKKKAVDFVTIAVVFLQSNDRVSVAFF